LFLAFFCLFDWIAFIFFHYGGRLRLLRGLELLFLDFRFLDNFIVHEKNPGDEPVDVKRIRFTTVAGIFYKFYQLIVEALVDVSQLLLDH
jgi:hypothetical protein